MKGILFGVLLLAAAPALGADANGGYVGVAVSCGNYVDYREEKDRSLQYQVEMWVKGYITAYNRLKSDTVDIRGGTNVESIMRWLDNWCRANPLEDLSGAMVALTAELFPRRYTSTREAGG